MASILRIRGDQLDAFSAAHRNADREQAEHESLALIRQHWSARVVGKTDEEVHTLVRQLLGRAEGFGLTSVEHGVRFVNASMALGPGFEDDPQTPWARPLLTSSRTAAMKSARLSEETRRELGLRAGER
ncbi:MAG: hypothetical protein ACRBN8_40580 [Nannocystales bacterium]